MSVSKLYTYYLDLFNRYLSKFYISYLSLFNRYLSKFYISNLDLFNRYLFKFYIYVVSELITSGRGGGQCPQLPYV